MSKLTKVTNYDDWEGIYLDGVLIEEGHHIDWDYVFKELGIELVTKEADNEWLSYEGSLPRNLNECKFAVQD